MIFTQPVAEVLEFLHVQVSSISCKVVGWSLSLHCSNADTQLRATGGQEWEDTTNFNVNWLQKSVIWGYLPDYLP